jgi:hypothetical protein
MIDLLYRGRHLLLESPLTPDEATHRLQREISAPSWPARPTAGLFVGTFADGRFRMSRAVSGRNSFRMTIEGTVTQGPRGTRIDARMKLHPAVAIFLLGWGACAGAFAALAVVDLLRRGPVGLHMTMLAFPAACAVFALVTVFEARKAARLLESLFEAPSVSSPNL